jgi:signal transduction histidine kinase
MTVSGAAPRVRGSVLRDLPLFWKLLIPNLVLILAIGSAGTYLLVHELAERAQAALDRELSSSSLEAVTVAHERELYALESVNLVANLEGMAAATRDHEAARVADLARSVLALKSDVNLVVIVDASGRALAVLSRVPGSRAPVVSSGSVWRGSAPVAAVLAQREPAASGGFIAVGRTRFLAVAVPICAAGDSCERVGAALAAVDAGQLVVTAADVVGKHGAEADADVGVTVFDSRGAVVASHGVVVAAPPALRTGQYARQTQRRSGREVEALYSPLLMQGRREGTLAVSVPARPALAPVSRSARWIVLVVLAGIVGVVLIGAALSRFLLARLRRVLETHRALGAGDLAARVRESGSDELAELARGVNLMAERLQASHDDLELRVRERTQEVQQLLEERTDLFTSVSHEFRTPLAVILAKAEAMQDPSYRRTVTWTASAGATIEMSARQLLTFVNEVLELARAESGVLEVEVTEVGLPDFMREMRGSIDGLAEPAGIGVRCQISRNLPPVSADPVRLREIVLNLVDNAVKYTPRGGRLDITAHREGPHVEVSVSDTGVGIPAEAVSRIFEPFYRVAGVKAQRAQPSSGLGLALTRRLVEAHGGTIDCKPRPSGGTTFTFTLPVFAGVPVGG